METKLKQRKDAIDNHIPRPTMDYAPSSVHFTHAAESHMVYIWAFVPVQCRSCNAWNPRSEFYLYTAELCLQMSIGF